MSCCVICVLVLVVAELFSFQYLCIIVREFSVWMLIVCTVYFFLHFFSRFIIVLILTFMLL